MGTIGGVCRWVKRQCLRYLVGWVMVKARRNAKPETVYWLLQIWIRKTSVLSMLKSNTLIKIDYFIVVINTLKTEE